MKPVLLLIPGMLNSADVWRHVVPMLTDVAELRIADVRTQDSIAAMARDAWALVADVPASRGLALCGFSMGGYVAIEMIANNARPISALGLLDTSGRPESPEGAAVREKTIAAIERDFDKVTAGVAQFGTHPNNQANAALMAETLAIMRSVGAEAATRQNRAIVARADHRALLATLQLPVLVMCGRDDRITPPALSEELAALIPGARLEWIDDAGHMTPLEQPARVARLLASLLHALQPQETTP